MQITIEANESKSLDTAPLCQVVSRNLHKVDIEQNWESFNWKAFPAVVKSVKFSTFRVVGYSCFN